MILPVLASAKPTVENLIFKSLNIFISLTGFTKNSPNGSDTSSKFEVDSFESKTIKEFVKYESSTNYHYYYDESKLKII